MQVQQVHIDIFPSLKKNNKQLPKKTIQVMGSVMSALGAATFKGLHNCNLSHSPQTHVCEIVTTETKPIQMKLNSRLLKQPTGFRTLSMKTVLIAHIVESLYRNV